MRARFSWLICAGMFAIQAMAAANDPGTAGWLPPPPAGQEWKLAWSDEFDGAQVDTNKWELLGDWKRRDGWWVQADSFLDGKGHLVLRTKKDGERFTSGAVRTRGRFEHAFGYWTARCQLPKQPGHWSAFWLMSNGVGHEDGNGRDGTEIDIAEFPWRDGKFAINLHWDGYGKAHKHAGKELVNPAITNGFHEFSLAWSTNEYVFYVDGQEVWRTAAGGVSQQPEWAKFSNEVGNWAGDIKQAQLPDDFVIDYIRVYDAAPKGQGVQSRGYEGIRPMLAIWCDFDFRGAGQGCGPFLRVAIWEDGRVVFATDPGKWGRELKLGRILPAELLALKRAIKASGVFDLEGNTYLVPDGPVHAIMLDLDGKQQMLYWDEIENLRHGINIAPKPKHLEFKRCWKAVNALALAALPKTAEPHAAVFDEVPKSWRLKKAIQSE